MARISSTPWHRESFTRFLEEDLPALLAERLPLIDYQASFTGETRCRIALTVDGNGANVAATYEDLPSPDADGIFWVTAGPKVVVPKATAQDLDDAEIRCAGQQLTDYIEARLGVAAPGVPWTVDLLRAWLPLGDWFDAFFAGMDEVRSTVQRLDETNWLARYTHLRRLIIPEIEDVIHPSHAGRVCPFETPEGPNLGYVLTIAQGAEVRDGKLIVVDDAPAAGLGLSASAMPFLEHDDPNRILMGANMLRQWVPQGQQEPARVRTGLEPDVPEFWNGRNLLTAFISWGEGTYDDGIVVSESAAQRFDTPYALQIGDKLSDRHGNKGVVSRILSDAEMPHMPDGTPVDLIVSFAGLHRRAAFGVIREALLGRIAAAEGKPATVPPFGAPGDAELHARLQAAALPEAGQVTLTEGEGGARLGEPSTVGLVYWGRLRHLAKDKLQTFVGAKWGQLQGGMECAALLQVGALETLSEAVNTASIRREDNDTLVSRVAAGPLAPAPAPTPLYADLVRRLRIGGIVAEVGEKGLTLAFGGAGPDALPLAQPVSHPWIRDRRLTEVGSPTDLVPTSLPMGMQRAGSDPNEIFESLVALNRRLAGLQSGHTPARLVEDAAEQLTDAVQAYLDAVLQPIHLSLRDRRDFTGRSVIVPGENLALDQVGLPEAMAWALFGPRVIRDLQGDTEAVTRRTPCAAEALDRLMAESWVLINHAPTWSPQAIVAFHPRRVAGAAIQLPPVVCGWLNAGFDGDQVAVILPLTEAAQEEAGERLSVAGHLRRQPALLGELVPRRSALWGLACLTQTAKGLAEISDLLGESVVAPRGFVTRPDLEAALQHAVAREGVDASLRRLEQLAQLGFRQAKASGASLAPFLDTSVLLPSRPSGDSAAAWRRYIQEVAQVLASPEDCEAAGLAPQCLMVRANAVTVAGGGLDTLMFASIIAGRGPVRNAAGEEVIVSSTGVTGLTPAEMIAAVAGARRGLAQLIESWQRMSRELREQTAPRDFSVLARARRSDYPGIVFARAAVSGEVDPLSDVESRLFVGLDPAG